MTLLVIDANAPPEASAQPDEGIVVIFRTCHPVTGQVEDSIAARLSIHHALALGEMLRRAAIAAMNPRV